MQGARGLIRENSTRKSGVLLRRCHNPEIHFSYILKHILARGINRLRLGIPNRRNR